MHTITKTLLCGALFTLALAGATFAQSAFLDGAAARRVLYNSEMRGEVVGAPFSECINAHGETFYRVQGQPTDAGRITVNDDGLICYSYVSTDYSEQACWRLRREGRGYTIVSEDGGLEVSVTIRPRRAGACFAGGNPFGTT
jgi:hypothetical protein